MVDKLADILPSFPGRANHTRCFLHTINLVAKLLIKEFDVTKKDASRALEDSDGGASNEEGEVMEDVEELNADIADYSAEDNAMLGDDDEGWINEVNLLSDHERKRLQREIRPVKLVLVKVSQKKHDTHH
jgi:hypothetical protein